MSFTSLPTVEIYTDGGCKPNPGAGGWGAVLISGMHTKEISGGDPATTNNRMELTAAISALRLLKQPCCIELHTDSQYLRRGITEWIDGWQAHGWRKANGQPVENADLWQQLLECAASHQVEWLWVKGHRGHPLNERADRLAREAARRFSSGARRDPPPAGPSSASADRRELPEVEIFTHGSALGTPGPAGYAAEIVYDSDRAEMVSGGWKLATSNVMALWSVVAALQRMRRPSRITVHTSSRYVLDGATKWLARWERKNWRTRDGARVRNREVWQELCDVMGDHDIIWVHDRRNHDKRGWRAARAARAEAEKMRGNKG